jgi:hypothetical protein
MKGFASLDYNFKEDGYLPARVRFSPKSSNIVIIADGLSSNAVAPATFKELGQPESAFQVQQVALLEYDKYSVIIQPAERRATITEKSGISPVSPLPTMMSRIIAATDGIKVSAVGFNFWFDGVTEGPSIEVLRQYINMDRFATLGAVHSAGFKVAAKSTDNLVQLNVDPVFGEDSVLVATVNYHFQQSVDSEKVLNSYRAMTVEAGELIKRVFDVA